MSKTDKTKELESKLLKKIKKNEFGCLEVTIGWFGKEIVDCLSYDYNKHFRCYEIKVSKQDFYSKAHKTFVGHYNYFVMPRELYEQVKQDIPNEIGVYIEGQDIYNRNTIVNIKKAAFKFLKEDPNILKDSLIRSMFREYYKGGK
jgi:hypothetical protein